jgi:Ca-activated chloride channel family protein
MQKPLTDVATEARRRGEAFDSMLRDSAAPRPTYVLHLSLTIALTLTASLEAQQPIDVREKFRAETELVTIPVTVRDAAGRLVTTLDRGDFIVEEDGTVQPITQFERDRVPVSLALAMDTSDSMRGERIIDAREVLANFLDKLLAPEDEASLLAFNHETRMLAGWTHHRATLRAKLNAIRPSGATAIYDAVSAALPLFESRSHPRGALLIVSDGADTASDITIASLKQQLVRSDVLLYAIAIDAPNGRTSTRVNPYTLNELTSQGGGYAEVITSDAELGPATERIADELNHQYLIGYTPTTAASGKYRAIRVRVKNAEYRVRSRRGVIR